MKVFILTRKKLILLSAFLVCFFAASIYSLFSFNIFAEKRIIPIYYVETNRKVACLTFDAGWGNEQTQTLLDILKKYNVRATFFLVGDWVEKYPESVKAISDGGHDIGNHSDTHPHIAKLSREKVSEQIENCNKKVEKLTGKRPILFRSPYGEYNNTILKVANELDMFGIQWNVDSLDWKNLTPPEMLSRIKAKICAGSIILLHNGGKNTPEALPQIIETLKNDGYDLIPVSELIYKENFEIDANGKQIQKS